MVGKSVKGTLKSKQSQPSPPTLAIESYGYALTGRVECLSANHPPVASLRLQAYRDMARSLGYPLAVVSLVRLTSRGVCMCVQCTDTWHCFFLAIVLFGFSFCCWILAVYTSMYLCTPWRMYLWWSLCTLYLLACQVGVAIGDSGLCCCVCVTSFKY